jgi:hypothetical protein
LDDCPILLALFSNCCDLCWQWSHDDGFYSKERTTGLRRDPCAPIIRTHSKDTDENATLVTLTPDDTKSTGDKKSTGMWRSEPNGSEIDSSGGSKEHARYEWDKQDTLDLMVVGFTEVGGGEDHSHGRLDSEFL